MFITSKNHLVPVKNRILRALPGSESEHILSLLDLAPLPSKYTLVEPEARVDNIYFIETGIVSMISHLEDGGRVEVGITGSEGIVGLPIVLGSGTSPWEGLVQVEGEALRMTAAVYRESLASLPSLLPLLMRFSESMSVQVAQSAACNARHPIEQRLARWILATHDRVGSDDFPMTQEFVAAMLGVRRPGVTLAMGSLQRAGLVRHVRGRLRIVDRANLENASCSCYAAVRARYAWLFD